MEAFISIIHIIIAVVLIVLVLAQDSKSDGMGMLGGGSSSVFGASGAGKILVTMTRWTAILFAATCIILTLMSTKKSGSVVDSLPAAVSTETPADASLPAAPEAAPAKEEAEKK